MTGVGFDVGELGGGSGLVGMRERAGLAGGRLCVESAPSAGTTARARFPLVVGDEELSDG